MSSGSEAIESLADATGVAPVTVRLHSRVLREHEPPLWLHAGHGRRNVSVRDSHLSNLIIAVATGLPADSAKNVLRYRALTSELGIEFGQCLDTIINDRAMHMDGGDKFHVDLELGADTRASVLWAKNNGTILPLRFLPPQNDLLLKETEAANFKTRLLRRVTITPELLDVLARLWRDSIENGGVWSAHLPFPFPAAATATTNENADLPARKSASVPDRAAQKQPAASTARKPTRAARDNQPEPKGSHSVSSESDPTSRRSP